MSRLLVLLVIIGVVSAHPRPQDEDADSKGWTPFRRLTLGCVNSPFTQLRSFLWLSPLILSEYVIFSDVVDTDIDSLKLVIS